MLQESCDPNGLECLADCQATIDQVTSHSCMSGNLMSIIRSRAAIIPDYGKSFLYLLTSCHPYEEDEIPDVGDDGNNSGALCEGDGGGDPSAATAMSAINTLMMTLAAMIAGAVYQQ